MLEREHGVVGSDSFLDGAVEAFNFGNMFIAGSNVEHDMEVSKGSTHRFKLIIGKDDGNSESPSDICANDGTKMLDDMAVLHCVQFTS